MIPYDYHNFEHCARRQCGGFRDEALMHKPKKGERYHGQIFCFETCAILKSEENTLHLSDWKP